MKRKTAYKMAIDSLTEARRKFAFDHNLATYHPAAVNEKATKKYQRITEAIEILENEMEHKQMELFA